jgi:hypothetical protein
MVRQFRAVAVVSKARSTCATVNFDRPWPFG